MLHALRHARTCFLRSCLPLLLAACDSREENPIVAAEPPSYGVISPEPVLTIADAAAPGSERDSRIAGTYRLQDGATVVARERQLVWYDGSGTVIRTSPRSPSPDYRFITWMRGFNGDSLIAWDAASTRLTVFDAQGAAVREFGFSTGTPPGMTLPHSVRPDGSLLAMAGPSHVQEWRDGWWAVLTLLGVSPEGARTESFGTALRHPCGDVVERCAAESRRYTGTWTAGRRGVFVARPDRAAIRWTSTDSVVELQGPATWARSPDDDVPTYSGLLVDASGHLWAQSGDLARVVVFTPDGELAGTVDVPPDLRIQQVGPDFVVGIVAAEGGERVQVHRLRR